jgi:addiction module HigA family antidote
VKILLEEFLKPMGLSQNGLARAGHVTPRINEIVLGKRDITADTDLRSHAISARRKDSFLGCR